MASIERRGNSFRVVFRRARRKYSLTLSTNDETIARGLVGGTEKTLMLLDQKLLKVPDGEDLLTFVVSNGQVAPASAPTVEQPSAPPRLISVSPS